MTALLEVVQRRRLPLVITALALVGVAAYRFTLRTLMADLQLDTPLAYLPLLPFIAVALAVFVVRRHRAAAPPARDRGIDAVIGIPLMLLALVLVTIVPTFASTYYWTDRPDVLSLACFVAGSVILLFGLGWFWRLRWPVLFLFLTWPALYLRYLSSFLLDFTNATNGVLAAIVPHLPIGVHTGPTSGLLLVSQPHSAPISVSVSTACAGAESVLGFLLVGGAFLTTRSGAWWRRLLWLLAGAAFAFVMNVVRITSVLGLVALGHAKLALGGYHAVIGMILFTVVVSVMTLLTARFGLQPAAPVVTDADKAPARRPLRRWARTATAVAMVGFTGLIAISDAALAPYAAFADGSGSPKVVPFSTTGLPAGWQATHIANYPWVTQYFGSSSTFDRYLLSDAHGFTAYADVIETTSKAALATYNVQNCFLFHRYSIYSEQRIDLGHGVVGLLLDYNVTDQHARWATASWAWPVAKNGKTYYERVLLTAAATSSTTGAPPPSEPAGPRGWLLTLTNAFVGNAHTSKQGQDFRGADQHLADLGRGLITATLRRQVAA